MIVARGISIFARSMFSNHDIARYYDLSEVHYRLFWNLDKSCSLHYGYWDVSTRNFHEALLNINRVLANKAMIGKDEKVLDAGCGVGGSALWLARERNCFVTGISLNEKQVQKASLAASKSGLSNRLHFEQKDYLNTGYPSASFDVIWAIESICYAYDKSLFLEEAFRLLKKGGRLIMADFFKADGLHGKAAEETKAFANSWAIDDFAVWEEFSRQAAETGFCSVESEDISKAILPSAKRLYRSYLIGKPAAVFYRLLHGKPTSLAANNVESARLQYKTLMQGWWQYGMVLAIK